MAKKYIEITIPRVFMNGVEKGVLSFYLEDNEILYKPQLVTQHGCSGHVLSYHYEEEVEN